MNMDWKKKVLQVLGVGLIVSAPVQAHTPYLVPNVFDVVGEGWVTLDASFAEHFFVPDVVFDNEHYEVTGPDGRRNTPETVTSLHTRMVVEHQLVEDGTYRFSTGRRLGREFKIYEKDGRRIVPEDENSLPEGVTLTAHFQSNTMAETFVTRGAPDEAALAARGDGIELLPLSHPNDLFAGDTLTLQALYYGEPVADLLVEAFLQERLGSDEVPALVMHSDSKGKIEFSPEQAGIYLLRTRYRTRAPDSAAVPEYSNTYTLVLEAFE